MKPVVQTFFDEATFSFTHLAFDPETKHAAVIDPLLDYDPAAVSTSTQSAQTVMDAIASQNLSLKWIIETHAHADHLSGADWLRQQTGAKTVIGEGIVQVQTTFNALYELEDSEAASASDFDRLVSDGEILSLGSLTVKVMQTPGHTPSCCTYLIGDAAFVGDTLFMPDFGTARCDFPGGSADQLHDSIQRILALPDDTRLFMCHDYMPNGRELKWEALVAQQKKDNIHVNEKVSKKDFVKMRTERDSELSVPKLILPALQVNIRAGRLPRASKRGTQYLKLPINKF